MASVVQGNRPLRIFSGMMLLILIVAHFMGSVDLTTPSVLWIMVLMSINALQASFTGFCPMFKDKEGNCVACGVQCSDSACSDTKDTSKAKNTGCCDGDSGCCESVEEMVKESKEAKAASCCSSSAECCSSSDCLEIKVLGTGCKTCDNTAKLIEQTAKDMGIKVCVTKVEDVAEIAAYGVMSTPGVVIHDQVVHAGGMPTKNHIKQWLED